MAEDFTSLFRPLGQVKTAGGGRKAASAVFSYARRCAAEGRGLSQFRHGVDGPKAARRLTDAIVAAEAKLESLPRTDGFALTPGTWAPHANALRAIVTDAAGLEASAGAQLGLAEVASIVADAAKDAPRVFAKAVGETTAAIGSTAGGVLGGLLGGLGIWAVLLVVVLAFLIYRKVNA